MGDFLIDKLSEYSENPPTSCGYECVFLFVDYNPLTTGTPFSRWCSLKGGKPPIGKPCKHDTTAFLKELIKEL